MNRKEKYKVVSDIINQLSKDDIKKLLSIGESLHKGIGSTGVKLEIESISLFAKIIPLTGAF